MRIYVDFDDVLCETARALCSLARELFGRVVPYEAVHAFDLRLAFGLAAAQHDALMSRAHEPAVLRALEATPGAVGVVTAWRAAGHEVQVVTGRPFTTRACSEGWLAHHGLPGLPLLHVDKYGREPAPASPDAPRARTLAEFRALRYDLAVEDAPPALDLLRHDAGCLTLVYDRPWNRGYPLSPGCLRRCRDWAAVAALASRRAAGSVDVLGLP